MLTYCQGDLFNSTAKAIGHGVNIRGKMHAGIANKFRTEYPVNYQQYQNACANQILKPGGCFVFWDGFFSFGNNVKRKLICNIASQDEPGPHAKYTWLESGLKVAVNACKIYNIDRLALPKIGCGIGGLEWDRVVPILEKADINIEVWVLP